MAFVVFNNGTFFPSSSEDKRHIDVEYVGKTAEMNEKNVLKIGKYGPRGMCMNAIKKITVIQGFNGVQKMQEELMLLE